MKVENFGFDRRKRNVDSLQVQRRSWGEAPQKDRRQCGDRRKHLRLEVGPHSTEKTYFVNEKCFTVAPTLVNLSSRGVGFLFDDDLEVGDSFNIALLLPNTETTVLCSGVVRFRENFVGVMGYGMEISPHPVDGSRIADHVRTGMDA